MSRYYLAVLLLLACAACGTNPPEDEVPKSLTLKARGLYTFPSPLSEIPDGAFSRADDVVIRREGFVETRRGFAPLAATFGSSGDRISEFHNFNGTLIAHTTANKLLRFSGGSWTAYSGTYTPPTGRKMAFVNAGKSLYFTTNAGVYRLDELTGTPMKAGVPQATSGTATLHHNGAHATGTVTLGGGAGNVTVTVNGTAVGPVTFVTSDTVTATAVKNALNANATVAALVTATSAGAVITLTAVNGGTAGNSITLSASRTAGTATASGATLAGGNSGSGWLPAGAQTAYRFVWGYRNANDRVILGAPSGRVSIINPATETLDTVTLAVPVPSWVTADYFLQVYRADTSASTTIPASDDMALAYEAYPTTAQIAAHSMTIVDVAPDELKGAPLYSSPNSGFAGSEKFEPPVCNDLAYFKERMWCASTVQRQRLLLTLLSTDSTSGGLALGYSIILTQGGVSEEYVADAFETPSTSGTKYFKLYTTGSASQNIADTTQSLVRVINASSAFARSFYTSGEYDSPGQVLIEALNLGAAAINVESRGPSKMWTPAMRARFALGASAGAMTRAANVVTVTLSSSTPHGLAVGDTFSLISLVDAGDQAQFPLGTKTVASVPTSTSFTYAETGANYASTGQAVWKTVDPDLTTDSSDAPNGVAYSEYAEPDAFPLGNYSEAGAANFDALRIIALGDTLFIFKEEGIYTLRGDSPETFSIHAFPTPAKLLAPNTAVVLGNRIYGLTDQGVMAISENGAEVSSRPIEGTLLEYVSGNASMLAATASYAFGVGYETEREYWLFLPSTTSSTYAEEAYVYNYATQTWVHWTTDATAGYVLPGSDVAYLGSPTANRALQERKSRTTADYQDANDIAITAHVDWAVRTGDNPAAQKHWRKVSALFETPCPDMVSLSMATELAPTPASGWFETNGLPYVTSYVPLEQSRSQVLTVGVSGGEVGKLLAIQGLSVEYGLGGSLR